MPPNGGCGGSVPRPESGSDPQGGPVLLPGIDAWPPRAMPPSGPVHPSGPATLPAIGVWPPRARWPEPLHRAVVTVRRALGEGPALVALSGGADSLALAVACAALLCTREGEALGPVGAVVVDHALQRDSAAVAAAAADAARALGLAPVSVTRVTVEHTGDGPEAEARDARRHALAAAAQDAGACRVLTAHTADDQAEQVLLGIARGSGTRSLAGIPARGELPGGVSVVRPLLGLSRAETEAVCRWAGVHWWADPHNADPAFLRSRVRARVLPALEDPRDGLGPGVREGLVRTAAIAAEDAAALDDWARRAFDAARREPQGRGGDVVVSLDLRAYAALPTAVRHRVLALAAAAAGAERPARERILAVDALALPPSGGGGSAGPVELAGGVRVWRVRHPVIPTGGGSAVDPGGEPCARLELTARRPRR